MDNNASLVSFDVRSILKNGEDPFKKIMHKVELLEVGQTLEIINTFEPIPLINVLKSKGYSTNVVRQDDLVITYFKKETKEKVEEESDIDSKEQNFDEVYKLYVGKLEYVDVRFLEMPEPMTTILEKLEKLPKDYGLLVDHKKVPQFLLPQLEERDFDIFFNEIEENYIQLLIRKRK